MTHGENKRERTADEAAMYLLDTNVVSELRKPASRINPNVASWVNARDPETLHLASISVFELELGVRRAEHRDPAQGERLRRWLDAVLTEFGRRILPFDAMAARMAAAMHVPDPRSDHDSFIAATALVHGLTVVTRNGRDFRPLGVAVIDPWV